MTDEFDRSTEREEALLRQVAPAPRASFVADLERRLVPVGRGRGRFAIRRPLIAGAAAAAALAALILVLQVAGIGPLPGGGGDSVRAGDDCRTVTVVRTERVPVVVVRDGERTLSFRKERVRRHVRRCH